MSVKFLLIDRDDAYRELLRQHLTVEWNDAAIVEHDPAVHGKLPDHFTGSSYDVVILDHDAFVDDSPDRRTGIEWLRAFTQRPSFPPVIFLCAAGDELLAVQAIKSGAADYIPKARMTHELLMISVKEAIRTRRRKTVLYESPAGPKSAGEKRFKGYSIQRELFHGPASTVFLASSDKTKTDVVLKVLRQVPDVSEVESSLDRFLQEYEVISRIIHPNVVRIHDHGITDDHAYIAMEYFPRGSLKVRLREPMTVAQCLSYFEQIARALGEIHDAGILHRDLKPANVMLRDDDTIALIDFGLAKQLRMEAEITNTGEVFGTPYYMSPEQGHAEAVDERADLYSLGVIFFEMLSGKKPFTGDTPMAVIYQHSHAPVPRLPDRFVRYQALIDQLMAKDPHERPENVADLLKSLSECKKMSDSSIAG